MTRSRSAKWAAFVSVASLAMASATIGGTQGAFAGQTDEGLNIITAMPDFRGPTVSQIAIGKSAGFAIGYIRTGATYRVYANVTDVGTPPSGTATVLANVNNVTTGQVAVPLVAGSYPAGGVTYNYRSAQLTANALPDGPLNFSVTATDVAANVTLANDSVTIDSIAPAPTNISGSGGGIAGRPEAGETLTLTTNDTLDTFRLLANWNGTATTVQVRFVNQGGGDRLQVWDSAGTTQIPFGTINLNRNDYTTGTLSFNGSTMTQSSGAITLTLGAPVVGTVTTVGAAAAMQWTPVATATDRAGNAIATAAFNEPNPLDFDF